MKLYRATAVTRRLLGELRHDRRSLAFILLMPFVAMFLFGFTFSGNVQDVNVVVVNQDAGATHPITGEQVHLAADLLANLDPSVLIVNNCTDYDAGLAEVQAARAWALLYFPENFSQNALSAVLPLVGHQTFAATLQNTSGDPQALLAALQRLDPALLAAMATSETEPAVMELRLDESSVNIAGAVRQELASAINATLAQANVTSALAIDDSRPVYGAGAEFIDYFAPGIISLVGFIATLLLTILTFTGERSTGTLDRMLATPLGVGEIVVGYAAAWSLVAMVQSALLIFVGVAFFGIAVEGNILLAFLAVLMLAVGSQALGMILSAAVRTPFQALQLLPLVMVPALLLSGVLWPLEAIPGVLRWVSYFVPVTYSADALRSVMLRGWGLGQVWPQFTVLLLYLVLAVCLSALMLHRRRKG